MTPSSTISNSIDLPPPPLRTTTSEGSLLNAEVAVTLLSGQTLRGRLQSLNGTREVFAIKPMPQGDVVEMSFDQLRYLLFTRELPVTDEPHPVEQERGATEAEQPFHVIFVDGQAVKGVTRGSFVDRAGLHLFKPVKENFVQRLFIPQRALKAHRIGPLLGDVLIKESAVRPQDVAEALGRQEVERRKPSGDTVPAGAVVTPEQLVQAMDLQIRRPGEGGQLTQEQLNVALENHLTDHSKKLGETLSEMGVVEAEVVPRALASKLGIPYVRLKSFEIDPEAVAYVPRDIARRYHLIPLCLYHDRLVIVMDDPTNPEAIDVVRFVTGRNVELAIATREDIEAAIAENYDGEETIEEDIFAAEGTAIGETAEDENIGMQKAEQMGKEKPIVRLVNRIIIEAVRRRASDIHVRPEEQEVNLLYRIDGTLIKIRSFSKSLLPAVISRIKIIGRMNIAERRLPQDGRTRVVDRANAVDLRISVIPTVNGESVVIRLLSTQVGMKTISQMDFNPHDTELVTDLLHKSYGLILVTGPTGSGKSTTLYAALQEVIAQGVNIITVEDPVEYHIGGIEQIQANTVPGYTFAKALRHILRHDPDVIMIGEIRDQETGKIAVESALTGHLVLSTLHTNDAAGAVTRLLEMGVEPALLNATLLAILAQRLVRRNCPHCIQEESPEPLERKMLGVTEDEVFYKGVGCEHCNNTGYLGRLAVYELLTLTPALREQIAKGEPVDVLRAQAIKDGMVPLTQNALIQARQRKTSLAEVYRVRLE
jgi:type IV pilus assembly protein PilB